MRRFESYPSKVKLFGLAILGLTMIAVSVFVLLMPGVRPKLVGGFGIFFFGWCEIRILIALFAKPVVKILMDEAGIHTGSSLGIVEWDDITGFRIDSMKRTKFLSVFVRDKDKYLDRTKPLIRKQLELHPALGVSEIALCFVGLSPGLDEACYYLTECGYQVQNAKQRQ